MQHDRWLLVLSFVFAALLPPTAHPWERGDVERFATLPPGAHNPEGITADRHGKLYVTTFDITRGGSPGQMFVYDRHGELERTVDIAGSSNLLLDLAFHPKHGALLVIDLGNQQVLKVNPHTGESSLFTKIPGGAAAGPNVLTFDRDGNVYVSDSFQGVIWKTGPSGGAAVEWVKSDLLATTGVPPFGANGLAFNKAGTAMFVANTGNDQVIRIPVAGGVPGAPEVFVNSVNGADGLIIDEHDNLWICANQADEIVVLDPTGRVIAKLGDFSGLSPGGAPRGLLFPASLVRVGGWIYVTNLSLDLRAFGLAQPVDAQWAADVRRHTVSRLKARIPPLRGLH
jgi:DNA-binding beta-propeller fold protein YncE